MPPDVPGERPRQGLLHRARPKKWALGHANGLRAAWPTIAAERNAPTS